MLSYTIAANQPHLRYMDITFRADTQGREKMLFQLPAWRPGRYELANFAQNIQKWAAYDENGNILPSGKQTKDLWEVDTRGAKEVSIRYNYYANQLDAGASYVDHTQVYVNPVNCLLYIPERMNEEAEIRLEVPENYQLASALDFNLHRVAKVKDFHQLADSPFIASPTLQHEMYAVGQYVFHIWFQGVCKPDWQKIKLDFWNFTKVQLDLFGEFPVKEYHFLFQVLNTKFYHGVEHLDSTVIALGPGFKLMEKDVYEQFLGVSSHELFHSWNIKSIRPAEMMPYEYSRENYSNLGYVAEGVTTYYGDLMLLRGGVFSWEQYAEEVVTFLHRYYHAFGFSYQTLAQASFDTWLDGYKPGAPDRKVNMYVKGMLLALTLDINMRRDTGHQESLDSVMRELYDEYAKKGKGYTELDYLSIIERRTGKRYKEFFDKYIWGLTPINDVLQDALRYVGCAYRTTPADTYIEHKLGLRVRDEVLNNRTIVNQIAPGSPAENAGLALNDEIIAARDILIDKNLEDILRFSAGEEVELMIARGKNIMRLKIREDLGAYFPIYKCEKLPNATDEQRENYKRWSGQAF